MAAQCGFSGQEVSSFYAPLHALHHPWSGCRLKSSCSSQHALPVVYHLRMANTSRPSCIQRIFLDSQSVYLCRWHARCFKCSLCQKPIGPGPVWTDPSQPHVQYCSNVCQATVHNPCSVCGAPLTSTVSDTVLLSVEDYWYCRQPRSHMCLSWKACWKGRHLTVAAAYGHHPESCQCEALDGLL